MILKCVLGCIVLAAGFFNGALAFMLTGDLVLRFFKFNGWWR